MTAYTDQRILDPGITQIAIKTNGGSVLIEKKVGEDWVTAQAVTADGCYEFDLKIPVRVTPSGGAAYALG